MIVEHFQKKQIVIFIAYVSHIFEHDELLGQFNEQQTVALAKKMQEAQGLMQAMQAQQAQQAALNVIEKSHPDFISVAQSEDFQQWVGASKVRQQLFSQANNYDADSALELLDTYKAIRGVQQQIEETSKAADERLKEADNASRSKALKTAAVQQGGTGESTKPIYRRADLIRLRMQDPNRYESMADDILQAYAEGRVR